MITPYQLTVSYVTTMSTVPVPIGTLGIVIDSQVIKRHITTIMLHVTCKAYQGVLYVAPDEIKKI